MIFLFGERVRSRSVAVGKHRCAVCHADTEFSETSESLWFSLFGLVHDAHATCANATSDTVAANGLVGDVRDSDGGDLW